MIKYYCDDCGRLYEVKYERHTCDQCKDEK